MKHSFRILVAALGISSPLLAIAQSGQELTREQVKDELIQYQRAGYNPARQNPQTWVEDAQAAREKVMVAQSANARTQFAAASKPSKCD
ncbi:MAG: DUF4148 domain-containing protein [Paraburkholderia sp.]|uniref:DUF4148 domain-containing protein n=1 Tax=Paraburkholderia sp. TaxID=1926495 RepID=UPI0011F5D567|nr:DUF4148 domain-containing protein [Paraburkholderia sp.]TAL93172.1 MAG: DUF4148 domain-containing protein [Paraburkholderia sp.]